MRNDKINYFVVGVFVITAFVVLVGILFYITGNTGAKEKYYSIYDNISGVKRGTLVTYEGYRFGQVDDIFLPGLSQAVARGGQFVLRRHGTQVKTSGQP